MPGPVVHGEEEQLLSAQEKQEEEEQQLQEQQQGERKEDDAPIVEDVKEDDSDNEDDDDDDDDGGGTEGELAHTLSRTPSSPLCHIFPEILDLNLDGIDLAVAEMVLGMVVTVYIQTVVMLMDFNTFHAKDKINKASSYTSPEYLQSNQPNVKQHSMFHR
uniref:Uncharacterized protein n=1 Tax=Musa acuminata subsp. malaccensis TaxID=214687 RepID=A0A804J7F9_MUSAM